MFQGAAALNLDAKGRLAIPARHRDALAVDNGQVVLTAHPHGCCLVYPVPAWIPIRDEVLGKGAEFVAGLDNGLNGVAISVPAASNLLQRIADVPINFADPMARRAPAAPRQVPGGPPG